MPAPHTPQSNSPCSIQDLSIKVVNPPQVVFRIPSGGSSIAIHAKCDDYKSDPPGNAGNRIACGVITE
jgi:Cu/Zn superoxide dismutase